jgi:hypothetical protein
VTPSSVMVEDLVPREEVWSAFGFTLDFATPKVGCCRKKAGSCQT